MTALPRLRSSTLWEGAPNVLDGITLLVAMNRGGRPEIV